MPVDVRALNQTVNSNARRRIDHLMQTLSEELNRSSCPFVLSFYLV